MHTETQALTLERLSAILRRRWWVIALTTIVVAGASFVFSAKQQKQYTATASVLFGSQQSGAQAAGLQPNPGSPSLDPQTMATDVQLLAQQSEIAGETARTVGRGLTASAVSQAISVSQSGQTDIADVSATSPSPALAADIANTYATQFIAAQEAQQQASAQQALNVVERQINALSPQQLDGTNGQTLLNRAESLRLLSNIQDAGVQLVSSAAPPGSPSAPRVKRNVALGVVIGLLLGIGFAFLLERLDHRMKDVEEVEAAYGLPLLATVPNQMAYSLPPRLHSSNHQREAEVFKLLRAYLRYSNTNRAQRGLLIASAASGDGRTTIARNLAEAAQETGTRTLLLEADLRRPVLASHYGLSSAPGLVELLMGMVISPPEAIRTVPIATRVNGSRAEIALDVLVAGHRPPNPPELLQSKAMADVLRWATKQYELVVIDTPPLGVVSDAMALLGNVDGVVLVSQVGKNTRDEATVLRERLLGVRAPLLGVVANGVTPKADGRYSYGYGGGDGDVPGEQMGQPGLDLSRQSVPTRFTTDWTGPSGRVRHGRPPDPSQPRGPS